MLTVEVRMVAGVRESEGGRRVEGAFTTLTMSVLWFGRWAAVALWRTRFLSATQQQSPVVLYALNLLKARCCAIVVCTVLNKYS